MKFIPKNNFLWVLIITSYSIINISILIHNNTGVILLAFKVKQLFFLYFYRHPRYILIEFTL